MRLPEKERGLITGSKENDGKIGEIAARLNRHQNIITKFLQDLVIMIL